MSQLDYLRLKTQVDLDTLDLEAGAKLGPFADLTSNQWETYTELCKPEHRDLIVRSVELTKEHRHRFPGLSKEEIAVEFCMVKLSLVASQCVTGSVHIMANPLYAHSTQKIVETGKRFHQLARILEPAFDTSRIVMKVPATWEGLQGCRELNELGIKTLATTVFTFAQAVLAGEVGCTSISPFVHDLKLHIDGQTIDDDPIFDLVVKAQAYYKASGIKTMVKACAVFDAAEALQLAGVDAFTLPAEIIQQLANKKADAEQLMNQSMFSNPSVGMDYVKPLSFVCEEAKFRDAMANEGRGLEKTDEACHPAIAIFSSFQKELEDLMKEM
ncbi:transaldolase [Aspergillus novoparasiticus]|uniref:Transaldolase n=1 Tax=Aspergillus novoparasiticus TaxID=986946 RepID=A0A5N6EM71_9EURO|nr:transaldolase [Aspergillus novoparasiticus]